jgi:hypothetical protein
VLALAAVNLLGAVAFAGLYAASAAPEMPSAGFRVGLLVAFAGVTAIWIRVESQVRGLDPFRRVGRGAIGLLMVLIGLPALVLMPLFWLESQLPRDAVPALHIGSAMALLLVALVLVVAVNVVGGLVAGGVALARRWRGSGTK